MLSLSLRAPAIPGLRRIVGQNVELIVNSAAISAGSGITSALGFVYWWVAARNFPAEDVGTVAALITMMGLVAQFGQFGLGTLLLGEVSRDRPDTERLIGSALAVALALSAVLAGFGWTLQAGLLSASAGLPPGWVDGSLFVAGCAGTAAALVVDQAFIALLRSEIPLYRNAAFSLIKLVLVCIGAAGAPLFSGARGLLLTWVVGLAMSLLVAALALYRRSEGKSGLFMPDFPRLVSLVPRVVSHHLLNISAVAPNLIFPFLVAVIFSPSVNAAFYPAWIVVNTLALVPTALSMVVFTIGSSDGTAIVEKLRFSLALSLAFCLVAGFAVHIGAHWILAVFNASYPDLAGRSLGLLGFGLIGLSIRSHYIAVARLSGRMCTASGYFAVWGILEIALACIGGRIGGLEGFTIGWLVAISSQALCMLRPTLMAACLWTDAGVRVKAGAEGVP